MFGFGEVEQLKKRLTAVLAQIKRSKIRPLLFGDFHQ
jgi:hypothetical protein